MVQWCRGATKGPYDAAHSPSYELATPADPAPSLRPSPSQAPPGAGKTTVVPLALLRHNPSYLGPNGKVMVLEPRRVAAKAAARRMAAMLGERVGETVGYRVKLDTRVGPKTRIEVGAQGMWRGVEGRGDGWVKAEARHTGRTQDACKGRVWQGGQGM